MARYYFQVWDRSGVLDDPDGVELPDVATARRSAVDAVRSLICDDVRHGLLDLRGRIEVLDVSGQCILTLPFAQAIQDLSEPL